MRKMTELQKGRIKYYFLFCKIKGGGSDDSTIISLLRNNIPAGRKFFDFYQDFLFFLLCFRGFCYILKGTKQKKAVLSEIPYGISG